MKDKIAELREEELKLAVTKGLELVAQEVLSGRRGQAQARSKGGGGRRRRRGGGCTL